MRARRERVLRLLLILGIIVALGLYSKDLSPPLQDLLEPWNRHLVEFMNDDALAENHLVPELPLPVAAPLGRHTYLDNGLLQVNPEGGHPIFELIASAEESWRAKRDRASTNFPQAVAEYKRRYKRSPPKGFDDWWIYVQENNVQLPDEYDTIYHDLEPFWGVSPGDLGVIREELEGKFDSFTLGKTEQTDRVRVLNTSLTPSRYHELLKSSEGILDLLNDVAASLPPFRAVFSPHDGPNRMSDYRVLQTALKAASESRYVSRNGFPSIYHSGWKAACSPDAPAAREDIDLDGELPEKSAGKSFVWDHRLTMDPCLHPRHFYQHGQFLSHGKGPTPQKEVIPEFSHCTSTLHHNIRIPTLYGWVDDIYPRSDDPEWADKPDERLLWRGRNTGMGYSAETRWANSHRIHLVRAANDLRGTLALLPPTVGSDAAAAPVGHSVRARKAHVNPALMDVAFTQAPIMCDEKTCRVLEELFPWREWQSLRQAGKYKYVMDADGNGWSGRFKRLLTSNAVVFKSTIYPEWYIDRIQPWLHYVPVQLDLSDLHDALTFFRGDAGGVGSHEELAHRIAVAGRIWSKTFWRREDLVAYFYRLILEYARVMSLDRDAMSYHG
ncbi:unnamed protein product [Mycena citricolor]|uniref:Glycosyl transferase CAP10 domain-containing protein n=1 Tax=Mycena citricolor TaxID=2018698 RepID=A0AAD2GTM8_9AGAR|nr:unnamed protein product [Mycena citricolor]